MKQRRRCPRQRRLSALARRGPFVALTVVAVTLFAACASSPGSGTGDWAKLYAYPLDDVWLAAEDAADSAGFDVEDADRESGRLRIASGTTTIELRLEADGNVVRVDAFLAGAGQPGPANVQRGGAAVESILNGISRILRERGR